MLDPVHRASRERRDRFPFELLYTCLIVCKGPPDCYDLAQKDSLRGEAVHICLSRIRRAEDSALSAGLNNHRESVYCTQSLRDLSFVVWGVTGRHWKPGNPVSSHLTLEGISLVAELLDWRDKRRRL